MLYDFCPGAAGLKTPTLTIKKCPNCGSEVEVFSTDTSVACDSCGTLVYNDDLTCAEWCSHAKECLGEELYNRLTARKEKKGPGSG
jgi:hypothetical protein